MPLSTIVERTPGEMCDHCRILCNQLLADFPERTFVMHPDKKHPKDLIGYFMGHLSTRDIGNARNDLRDYLSTIFEQDVVVNSYRITTPDPALRHTIVLIECPSSVVMDDKMIKDIGEELLEGPEAWKWKISDGCFSSSVNRSTCLHLKE
ncbi:hypothetical protein BDW59DRAFT_165747 [Aspergillus cavernicola]|uniref:Uncharacterized protein n=1 Tax=Aspergillus cavernicola TaxID=176166 RepID=A0ABR4HR08_9EURO